MQAELAEELNLSIPTVKEHLNAMEKAGLVEKMEEGRKWKYYKLTTKGKALFEPEEERFKLWIMLGVFVLAVAGGIAGMFTNILPKQFGVQRFAAESITAELEEAIPGVAEDAALKAAPVAADTAQAAALNPWILVYVIVILVLLIALIHRFLKYRRAKEERHMWFRKLR